MTRNCTGLPTPFRESADDTPARLPHHLTCTKARPGTTPRQPNCRKIQQTTPERRLGLRLADHALGRGARLTQVQVERGGWWVLAQTQPGGRGLERRLKQHGAARRCEVCKAVDGYRAGELTAEAALVRAGWDRSTEAQRSILLEIFGIPKPSEAVSARSPEVAPAQPADVSPQEPQLSPEPDPQLSPEPDPVIDAVVDALIQGWRSPKAEPQPQASAPEPEAAEPELEAAL